MSRPSSRKTSPSNAFAGGNYSDVSPPKRSGGQANMRRSTGSLPTNFGALAIKSAKSGNNDLERIEAEYIKNLQQQVYFLELEANYLREQARKATDMHPHMTQEAERMLGKLRQMQTQIDGLTLEVKRKQANIEISKTEQEKLLTRLKSVEEAHYRDKHVLTEEIVQLKKERVIMERDLATRDVQLVYAKEELDKSSLALRNAETKIGLLKSQVEQRDEQQRMLQNNLEEKRKEMLKTETMLHEIEDKYFNANNKIQEQAVEDLRTQISMQSQKLREGDLRAEHDKFLRTKLTDDSSRLTKENAILEHQISQFHKQLDMERQLSKANEVRRSNDIVDLVSMRDREKQLKLELEQVSVESKRHLDQYSKMLNKISKYETDIAGLELSLGDAKGRLSNMQNRVDATESEAAQLKHDKALLVEHVADLQRQMNGKERELLSLHAHVHKLENQIKEVEQLKGLESNLHSQKWEEFSRLADSMKHLSRSLTSASQSPSTTDPSQLLPH